MILINFTKLCSDISFKIFNKCGVNYDNARCNTLQKKKNHF